MSRSSSTPAESEDRQSDREGGEKREEQGPPKPVGFWHRELSHVRNSVISPVGKDTGEFPAEALSSVTRSNLISPHLVHRDPMYSLAILGCAVQGSRQDVRSHRGRGQL